MHVIITYIRGVLLKEGCDFYMQDMQNTVSPEQAMHEIEKRGMMVSVLSFAVTIAIVALIELIISQVAPKYNVNVELIEISVGVVGLMAGAFVLAVSNSMVENRCLGKIKSEVVEDWTRELIIMRARSKALGATNGAFLGVNWTIDQDLEYRYLYDTGDGFKIGTIPVEKTKIYPLGPGEAPRVVRWVEVQYRESLLTDPPIRIPCDRKKNDLKTKSKSGYKVYIPADQISSINEML